MILKRLIDYCDQVLSGEIITCKKHLWAVERFMNDLKRQNDDDFEFYFDSEQVEDFYEWSKLQKHTKGELAGQTIDLVDFQIFITANLFGWKRKKDDGYRFSKAYIQMARKQAKSQLVSLIASYRSFLSNEMEETYISGWDKIKSLVVYKEILAQLKGIEVLKGKYSTSYNQITVLKNGSIIKALSRENKDLDGVNASCVIIDEFHTHKTTEIADVMESSMVSRKSPLFVIITTAGFDLNAPCFAEYQYASKVVNPNIDVENDNFFVFVAELDEGDDWNDEKNWIKANPLTCSVGGAGLDFLKKQYKMAKDFPDRLRNFLTKHMNKWVMMKNEGFLDMQKFNDCVFDVDLNELKGFDCVVGVDLSSKLDLTSVSFLFYKDEKFYIHNHSFLPSETIDKVTRENPNIRYDLWVDEGFITKIDGALVDFDVVESYILNLAATYRFNILEIAADPWNATQFLTNMEKKGFMTVEIRQGMRTMAAPTKEFREYLYNKDIIIQKNPVLSWCSSNAHTTQDENANIRLVKKKSIDKIDALASVINCFVRANVLIEGVEDLDSYYLSDDFSF